MTVRGAVDDAALWAIVRAGTTIDGDHVAPRLVTLRKRSGRETHLVVELVEERDREIRRLVAAAGHVGGAGLRRVSFGGVELGTLAPGRWRVLSYDELRRVRGEAETR